MQDVKKWLIPLIVGSLLSIAVGVYGISIIPRVEGNERGIEKLLDIILDMQRNMATKEDIKEVKQLIKDHDSSNR